MGYSLRVGLDLDGCPYNYVEDTRNVARAMVAEGSALMNTVYYEVALALKAAVEANDLPATHWNYFEDWGIDGRQFAILNRWGMERGFIFRGGIEDGWLEAIDALIAEGHSIHIVTHRSQPGAITATEEWLSTHGVKYDSIHFVSHTSQKLLVDMDVLVDDRVENVQEWEEAGRTAIMFARPWNDRYNGRAIRVYTPRGIVAAVTSIARMREAVAEQERQEQAVTPPRESVLEEAQRLVHGNRGSDYGHPIHDFTRTGAHWGATLSEWKQDTADDPIAPVPPELVGLCMVGVKLSREVNKPKRDNRVDGPGYFETVDMIHAYRESNNEEG